MHKRSIIPVFIFLLISLFFSSSSVYNLTLNDTPIQVYFYFGGGCTEAIGKEIDSSPGIYEITLNILKEALQ